MLIDVHEWAYRASKSKVMEEVREVVSYAQMVAASERRSWGEFTEVLRAPQDSGVVGKRVAVNLVYFRVNYAMIGAASLATHVLLWRFKLVFPVLQLLVQAFFMLHYWRRSRIHVLGRTWMVSERLAFCVGCALVTARLCESLAPLLSCLGLAVSLSAAHAVLRPPSAKSHFSSLGSELNLEVGEACEVETPSMQPFQSSFHTDVPMAHGPSASDQTRIIKEQQDKLLEFEQRRARNEQYARDRNLVLGKRHAGKPAATPAAASASSTGGGTAAATGNNSSSNNNNNNNSNNNTSIKQEEVEQKADEAGPETEDDVLERDARAEARAEAAGKAAGPNKVRLQVAMPNIVSLKPLTRAHDKVE